MIEIKAIVYILCSFFNTDEERILAETTVVSVDPIEKKVKIFLDETFAIIKTNEDFAATKVRLDSIVMWSETNSNWSKELDVFLSKNLEITYESYGDTSIPKSFAIELKYENEYDLEVFGIWFNKVFNQFSINKTTDINMYSDNAQPERLYVYFDASEEFNFIIKPYNNMSADFQEYKLPISEFLFEK